MITISKVKTKKELNSFIDFPHDLYKNDTNYVPELFIAQRDLLNGKHPFFAHSKTQYFLAKDGNKIVGRIAAIKNGNHIKYTGNNEGFFGFFDTVNDYTVTKSLFDSAIEWLRNEKLTNVVGPTNFSTNETCGLLIDGYDTPPPVMLTYNKPYYASLVGKYGFTKKMDLFAYKIAKEDVPKELPARVSNLEGRLHQRGITIRNLNIKDFDNEVKKVMYLYNNAWDKNWGFVPMTDDEFKYMAKDMKMMLDVDFATIAEHNGEPIGFSLTLPDVNVILRKIPRGRLLPTGIFKLLLNKKNIKQYRVITLGVLEKYRRMGIDACFYTRILETGLKKGLNFIDASWILENNVQMNAALQALNGKIYKTYRMYQLSI